MPEEDARIFSDAYELYEKYRYTEMRTDEQWAAFVNEVRSFAERHAWRENKLAERLGLSLIDTLNDLYADGKKPAFPDYFGRSDL